MYYSLSIKKEVSAVAMKSLNEKSRIKLVKLEKECETGGCPVISEIVIDSLSSSGNDIYLIIYLLYYSIFYCYKNYVPRQTALSIYSLHISIVLLMLPTKLSQLHNSTTQTQYL